MAPRSFWKGYLKLSLVTCPVAMSPAISAEDKVRFRTLNRYADAVTGKAVNEDDEVKGYPRGEEDYVMLEDEEIEAVALESTRTIDIESFVPRESIEWIWYDSSHYLVPNDTVGEEAFSVIREAMAATSTVGISRLVLYRRERAVMLEPRGKGIVLWTLRYGDEVRDEKDYFAGLKDAKPESKALSLVKTLIKERTKDWDPKMADDPVQDRLLDIIAAKKKGRKRPAKAKAPPPTSGNVVNIMDALRKSIKAEGKGR
jgi:DNA end-binding protein Ku